jgi:hypothetical protein
MHPPAAGGERSLEAAACRTSFGGYPQTILSKIWSTITAKASILVSALLVSSVRASSVGLVQVAVDTEHHLIVAHEVTNVGNDTAHLSNIAGQTKAALGVEKLEVIADRGYFDGEEILACDQADITIALPKPQRSGAKSEGRFGKQDFVYLADEDVYRCPAGEKLRYRFTAEEHGQKLRRHWTDACRPCPIKVQCTTDKERRITRWEHEEVVEAVQERLDKNPDAMRTRRETVEHPFGTMKMRMGATHFLTKTLPKVATEMALCVLTYNLTRVLNIVGIKPLMTAIQA